MAIIHVTGMPRHGKSSYVTARILNEDMTYFNSRYKKACAYIKFKNKQNGTSRALPPFRHVVYGNMFIYRKFPYMCMYPMSGWEFGAKNNVCPETLPIMTFGVYAFDEARKYFGSKSDNRDLPPWVVQAFEQHGHSHLKIFLITHRPEELNKDIRPLCEERIHIEKTTHYYKVGKAKVKSDKLLGYGKLYKTIWHGRQFDNLNDHENYVDGKDKTAGKPYKYVFHGAINNHYNPTQFANEMEDNTKDFRYLSEKMCNDRPNSWSNYKKAEKVNGEKADGRRKKNTS